MESTVNVSLPEALALKLKEKMKETDFTSLDSYISHILRSSISALDDEAKVKERLRGLGYLD